VIRTPFTPFALRPLYHFLFAALCGALFASLYLLERPVQWVYWAGGLFLGALGGLMQIWSVEEVVHSRKGAPSWREFRRLVESTRWGKGYLLYSVSYILLVLYLGSGFHGNRLENAAVDYLSFVAAKEMVTLKERRKLEAAFSFKEKRFEWARLPRHRETRLRRFIRRWFHFV
jgi:hypothetical protein